jgi:acetyl esterase/lipase
MRFVPRITPLALVLPLILVPWVRGADAEVMTRTEDVIYGRKFGTALTMDVFTPKKEANGAAVIYVVSGGWFSSHEAIDITKCEILAKRGYTVFAVVHGSQPRFTIPDAVADMNRAVRFIRTNAKKYGIDPDRIGITGGSAGGHLSLMQGLAGDDGNPKAGDPVERASSKVQAVACFFPPTDFLNWGEDAKDVTQTDIGKRLRAPFDFQELDSESKSFIRLEDKKYREVLKQVSPITHVKEGAAPMLIIHGDKDKIVPIQQAKIFAESCKDTVTCELVIKKGADHGWTDMNKDVESFADWFDKYLKKK